MLIALHLKDGSQAPPEYVEYTLCKLFHCLPSQLDDEDAETMTIYLAFYNAETEHAEALRQATGSK